MRILIAHDDRRELVALRQLLVRAGHEVIACDCAARVLAVSATNRAFEVALLEMNMGATALAQQLRVWHPSLFVIFVTGSPSEVVAAIA